MQQICCEIDLRWMPKDLTYEKLTLVQVMAWGRQEQAIASATVDQHLWRHMAPLGHNELILFFTKSSANDPCPTIQR